MEFALFKGAAMKDNRDLPSRRSIHLTTPNGVVCLLDAAWKFRRLGDRENMRIMATMAMEWNSTIRRKSYRQFELGLRHER